MANCPLPAAFVMVNIVDETTDATVPMMLNTLVAVGAPDEETVSEMATDCATTKL
jgi:hypothetical protein